VTPCLGSNVGSYECPDPGAHTSSNAGTLLTLKCCADSLMISQRKHAFIFPEFTHCCFAAKNLGRLFSVDSNANSEQCSNASAHTFTDSDSGKDTLQTFYFAWVSALCSKCGKQNLHAFLGIVLVRSRLLNDNNSLPCLFSCRRADAHSTPYKSADFGAYVRSFRGNAPVPCSAL
jgi:hypothetical protein